jgi:uncharacterized membrane protein YbjE (DUF340 family)
MYKDTVKTIWITSVAIATAIGWYFLIAFISNF